MSWEDFLTRRVEAGAEFNRLALREDGLRLATSLADGLATVRDVLYHRLHEDVERLVGRDTMLIPVSEVKTRHGTKLEIEVYQIAESAIAARELGYLGSTDTWYWQWLSRFRQTSDSADEGAARPITSYLPKSEHQRRLEFTDVLTRVLPESRRAPLVLFRLLPYSIQIVTALAFSDSTAAAKARANQLYHLPAIGDCRSCRGKVLDNGEQCSACGNPLWKSEWLTATD
jgi:hypothetical protein